MSDLVRTLAFAFRRKGADVVPGTELRLLLAYDLRWFAPEDAKRVVARAIELGLVEERDGTLRPLFDVAAVQVPLSFRPSLDVLEEPAPTSVPERPREGVREDDRAAMEERARRGGLVSLDVARLIVARRAGEDVRERAADAERRLLGG